MSFKASFDTFSSSANFGNDAKNMLYYTRNRMQDTLLDIELTGDACVDNYYTAVQKYYNRVSEYFFRNHLLDLNITGDNSVLSNMTPVISEYQSLVAGLVGMGANKTITSFSVSDNVQDYEISSSLPSGTNVNDIKITEVFYSKPSDKVDLIPGIGANQGLVQSLGVFGANPMFMPNKKTMMIYPSSEIARWRSSYHNYMDLVVSDYRYEILDNNKKIRLIPAPNGISTVYFEYVDKSEENYDYDYIISPGLIPDIQFSYDNLNLFAKGFIIEIAYGLNLISIGEVRSKYDSIPIPDANITLNGDDLISRGQDIIERTTERLDTIMEKLNFTELIRERGDMIETLDRIMGAAGDVIIG